MAWYEYPTNYSGGKEVNGTADFFMDYPKSIIGDNFAPALLIGIWVATYVLSLAVGNRKAMLTASFISFIFGGYFIALGIISWQVMIILSIILGAQIALEITSKNSVTY